ncbi:MAG TPA: 2-oxoglutarate and iron-dependent oxygenase domain-containing protein [Rhodopila sp.]|nr:2-oxoglutarate and iron-dependent oxygenase domain-containing protein [Rhodopila sp.]
MQASERIPVLDIGPYLAGVPGARAHLAEVVARTCMDTGFLVITNHGIAQPLIDDAFAAAADFFDMDEQRKLALKVGDLNIGYLPYGAQIVRTSKINNNTKPNLSESFYIVTDLTPDDPRILARDPLYGLNRWPMEMPSFKARTMAYFAAMRPLAHQMVSVIATSLGLPDGYFDSDFHEPTITLRLIRYPSQDGAEDNQFGFAPHIDTSFLTLLAQSALPGLEVRTAEGDWIRPPAIPGTFVVNTGEMLARYSNDRYTPTPHRVINANNALRHAIPFFYGPALDAVIRCVPTCVGADNPARYEPLLYSDHRRKLHLTNFDHRRKAAEAAA